MRLAWLTDIHLDFLEPHQRRRLADQIVAEQPDGVVITGDIATGPTVLSMLGEVADVVGTPLWFVLGNHDFYRSSIARVRAAARELTGRHHRLAWLGAAGVVRLGPRTALVGHDGWGDGRLGDLDSSRVLLNDFLLIEELSAWPRREWRARLASLGDEAAAHLRAVVDEALAWAEELVVAIHVPPFRDACWHDGAISGDDWLPFFTCDAAGRVLRDTMAAHPAARMTVLCGHTHSAGVADVLPNLRVRTGGADYGAPRVQDVLVV